MKRSISCIQQYNKWGKIFTGLEIFCLCPLKKMGAKDRQVAKE
jgi:hypothetical protein